MNTPRKSQPSICLSHNSRRRRCRWRRRGGSGEERRQVLGRRHDGASSREFADPDGQSEGQSGLTKNPPTRTRQRRPLTRSTPLPTLSPRVSPCTSPPYDSKREGERLRRGGEEGV
ncbi:hypothetical protein NL676_037681 [Syzygium grande]|nr:hypothetical protein NL676_037681 [Syzygium grande]